MSTARAFLKPAKSRSNLTLRTNAHATRLLLDGKKAVGVAYARGGQGGSTVEVRASREVILSGGAINSPQILQLSGVGPGELLRDLGIHVVHELPGVGENLRDHYAPRFSAKVKNIKTINELSCGINVINETIKYFAGKKSILSLSPSMVYGFWHTDPASKSNDLQFIFTPASYKMNIHGALNDYPGFTVATWQHRPESKGYIRAKSSDPFAKPTIQPNYLTHETDRQVTIKAMKLSRLLGETKAMKPFFDGWEYPDADIRSDDELLDAARHVGNTTYHVMGSCRMGPDSDPTAVVDDQLRVRGMENLRVIDASVMPAMISANLNAATMMIGEKGAALVMGKPALEPVIIPD